MAAPGEDLHHVATGPAKAVVDRHQKEEELVLYGSWFCPFVQRVWILLELKQVPYQYVEVNPFQKPASLLAINPRGLVPALMHKSKPLYDSAIICEFLEEAFPSPALLPKDAYDRAYARLWIDYVSSRIIPALHRYLQFLPVTDVEGLEEKRREFLDTLKEFTKAMRPAKEGGFFLGGGEVGLVDVIAAPWIQRLWVLDEYKGPFSIPEEDGEGGVWERWRAWVKSLEGVEPLWETESEREPTRGLYKK
ncbi:thioredoxin-like protein [Choiromyces venosus 120613-1]|uniref:Thioredoxin-like protein n=1 Tax=Choiromyces venosus 120613-1 TaxID=1336337 RepID=A0A3N4JWQ1_9PEZI|nr:thioredoxin-like protein [Choiromyces venosus 120613-1]